MLRVRGASKRYASASRGLVRALIDVSLDINVGESVGLVGESGCGKSTLARAIVGLTNIDSGSITIDGIEPTRRRRSSTSPTPAQYVFQDPFSSLTPRMRVGAALTQVVERHQGLKGPDCARAVSSLLDSVGLSDQIARRYPHELSGGMRQRVGIARALAAQPRLLVLDEPVSALDVSVRAEILNLLADIKRDRELSLLVISHDLGVVHHLCERTVVMYLGSLVEEGSTNSIISDPLHPYTRGLVAAVPSIRESLDRTTRGVVIEGEVDASDASTSGCAFAPRCPVRLDECVSVVPLLTSVDVSGRSVACHVAQMESRSVVDRHSSSNTRTERDGPR